MEYALFLGCLAPLRYPGIESSTRAVMDRLGVRIHDIEGFSCCPAPGLFRTLDSQTWLSLGARNLCLAEEKGYDVMAICNGCFTTLSEVNDELKEEPRLKEEVNHILASIRKRFTGNVEVLHFIDVLYEEVGIGRIEKEIIRPLTGLRVAAFCGCHYLARRGQGNLKKVESLNRLVEATGAKAIDYSEKMMCCGAGKGMRSSAPNLGLKLTLQKIRHFAEADADCIVDICPFCHLQFDRGQVEIQEKFGEKIEIPVLNYSQLLCLAFGVPITTLGFEVHAIPVERVLKKALR